MLLRVISARTAIRRMRKHSGRQRQEIPGGACRPVPCSGYAGVGRWEDPDMIIAISALYGPFHLPFAPTKSAYNVERRTVPPKVSYRKMPETHPRFIGIHFPPR